MSEDAAVEPFGSSHQLLEVLSWRLASGIVRRFPSDLQIVETHPGGGMYDCLTIVPIEGGFRTGGGRIDLNRVGSVHVPHRFDNGVEGPSPFAQWRDVLATDDVRLFADSLCTAAGLRTPSQLPASTSRSLVYRFLSSFLGTTVFTSNLWRPESGYADSSGAVGSDIRQEYFDLFPLAAERLRVVVAADLLNQPAYRFWFLTLDGEPQLALETTGVAWTRNGEQFDLSALYAERGRRINRVITEVVGDLLP